MQSNLSKLILNIIFLFITAISANAQEDNSAEKQDRNIIVVGTRKTLKAAGKATYVVARETAQAAWKVTKVAAVDVAAPVGEAIVVKTTPKVSKFVLRRGAPIAAKLLLKYLML